MHPGISLDWNDLLISFLHDPPDKALSIKGHENRAARYVSAAVGREVSRDELHGGTRTEDILASIAERLPMPTAGSQGERAVGQDNGRLTAFHPFSGSKIEFALDVRGLQESVVQEQIEDAVKDLEDPRQRFLAVWRLLPERLAARDSSYAHLPADTRIPDHTIWNHMDITAGLHPTPAVARAYQPAFLSFSLGRVQPFIAAARSVRDLWSGSAILSWLTFQGMLPLIRALGPTAFVFPSLRGVPLLDLWLRREAGLEEKLDAPEVEARKAPCVPNRFLAIVPWGENGSIAQNLARQCDESVQDGWKKLADSVREELNQRLSKGHPGWDKRWDEQIDSFFETRPAVLPWRESKDEIIANLFGRRNFSQVYPDAAAVRGLGEAIPAADRPGYPQDTVGRWQANVELSARLMESIRSVRHIPPPARNQNPEEPIPAKCTILGSYEQMGPEDFEGSRDFWEKASKQVSMQGVRLRQRERLCAVALAKRFAAPAFLCGELGLNPQQLRFPDMATVAAADWLKRAREMGIDLDTDRIRQEHDAWSGQWLHWPAQDSDPDEEPCPREVFELIHRARTNEDLGPPPAYSAVLAMDADSMGQWLRGDKSPPVRDVLHPRLLDYYEGLSGTAESLDARRPVGPALHAAISEALTNFAVHVVPQIVAGHSGTLIYSGGDDLLALLPVRTVLACARELRAAFCGEALNNGGANPGYYRTRENRDLLMMGPKATLSAGLAIFHHKEDLRLALDAARTSEATAKEAGRDALQFTVWRRSGEHASALCPWEMIAKLEEWIDAFEQGASSSWVYRLRTELPTLTGPDIPLEAVQAEIRRQVNRTGESTRELLGSGEAADAGDRVAGALGEYREMLLSRIGEKQTDGVQANGGHKNFIEDFVTLIQSSSFLARGRDA